MSTGPEITDQEVDVLIAAFNGSARETVRALMHDLAIMVDQSNQSGSRGFLRRDHRMSVSWGKGREPRAEVA